MSAHTTTENYTNMADSISNNTDEEKLQEKQQ